MKRTSQVSRNRFVNTTRVLLIVFAVCAVMAIAPRLRSAMPPGPPAFTQTNLVSDLSGFAKKTDPLLVNPWGMALGLNGGIWIGANGSGTSVSYDGSGQPVVPDIVIIDPPGNIAKSAATGAATNGTTGFVISANGGSGPAAEIFATEDGTIAGWNSMVNPTRAVIAVDNSDKGAIYKGLAIGFNEAGAFLYATNFHDGTIDVFDSKFHPARMSGNFNDPQIPKGYAPFGIQAINGALYVTYAMQDEDMSDDVPGPGHGFIDVFDTHGKLMKRFTGDGQRTHP